MEEKKELKQDISSEEYKKVLDQKTLAQDKLHKNIITKMNLRILLLILALTVLGIGLYVVLRETGVINKYAYEEVDNLAEREGVCFNNLLFSYYVGIDRGSLGENRWLCIMNTGDVYAFEWTNNRNPWDFWYSGDERISENSSELRSRGYQEANWGKMENVVYLGRFSDSAVRLLNSYVENYDLNAKYYYLDPPEDQPQGGGAQQERDNMNEKSEEAEWSAYGARLYWHRLMEDTWIEGDNNIEWCRMNPTWWGGYEKEIQERSLDENAIAAIELFESSGFYDRWVKMCLNGY